jgi:two-component system, NarL family, nitrate/nitrite response regulator NarL
MVNDSHPIRVVIAARDAEVRRTLREALESEPGVCVIGERSDPDSATRLTGQSNADVLLIDLALARESEINNRVANCIPTVRTVVTLRTIDKADIVEAFRLGAHGVVPTGATSQVLLKSFRAVMAGQYWLERQSVGVLIEALRESLVQTNEAKSPRDYGLTRREVDIITKIVSGRSNKEVGEEFAISERTVKHHLTNIFGKVGVTSRLQLALFAVNQHFMNASNVALSMHPMNQDDEG